VDRVHGSVICDTIQSSWIDPLHSSSLIIQRMAREQFRCFGLSVSSNYTQQVEEVRGHARRWEIEGKEKELLVLISGIWQRGIRFVFSDVSEEPSKSKETCNILLDNLRPWIVLVNYLTTLPVLRLYCVRWDDEWWILRDFEGAVITYRDTTQRLLGGTEKNQENLRMAGIPAEIQTDRKIWRHYVPPKRRWTSVTTWRILNAVVFSCYFKKFRSNR
jgi:hypothetical protein